MRVTYLYVMPKDTYTLSDIVALTGAKPRAIQLWADAGVLSPSSASGGRGSGVHRRFRHREVEIAAIIAPLSKMGVTIGHLKRVATETRKMKLWARRRGDSTAIDVMERARRGQGENYLMFSEITGRPPKLEFCAGDDGSVSVRLPHRASGALLVNLNDVLRPLNET
jgi:DNA-binding transcriptional MerR regulator